MCWSLEFCYADVVRRWPDGVVVFHPLSGDTFELNELSDAILCCLDGQPPLTTAELTAQIARLYDETEELPVIVGNTLRQLQTSRLVQAF